MWRPSSHQQQQETEEVYKLLSRRSLYIWKPCANSNTICNLNLVEVNIVVWEVKICSTNNKATSSENPSLLSLFSISRVICCGWEVDAVYTPLNTGKSIPHIHSLLDGWKSTFGHRLINVKCSTECYRRSFLPVVIKLKEFMTVVTSSHPAFSF